MKFIVNIQTKVFCRVGVSKIHGVGVIAITSIPPGINPMEDETEAQLDVVPDDEMQSALKNVPDSIKQLVKDMCPFRPEENEWDVPSQGLNSIGVAYYLNHSSTPNMEERDGNFFTLRPIEPGEELTVDYGTYGALNL